MRPFEVILLFANALSLLGWVLPLPDSLRGARAALPLIALAAAVAQLVLEGPRWQMLPAYGLALALAAVALTGAAPGAAGVGVGLLMLLISVVLPALVPVFRFSAPGGPYSIGTVTYHWTDASRPELFTPGDPADHRELMAQVWYPAEDVPGAPRAPYVEDAAHVLPALAHLFHLPSFFFTHFRYVTTHAVEAAPVAAAQPRYPVLIFLTGLGGFRQSNTAQVEALVSHGYVVVGLDQPGGSVLVRFPDGREVPALPRDAIQPSIVQSVEPVPDAPVLFGEPQPEGIIPYFAADVPFALDRLAALDAADPQGILTGRLDLSRAGIFGISLGGINAAEACWLDDRLDACLIMDVFISQHVVEEGLDQPVMIITRSADTMRLERERAGGWTETEIEQHVSTMRAVYEQAADDSYYLQVEDMFHVNMTDAPYWTPLVRWVGMAGPLDGGRVWEALNAYSVAFFDQSLKGEPSPLLDGPSAQYPEVEFETRRLGTP